MDSVVLVKAEDGIYPTLGDAIRRIGGFRTLRSPLLIKPNICTDVDSTGAATTNVQTVEALMRLVFNEDRTIAIRIVESDSESKFADEAYQKFGYTRLEERYQGLGYDVELINLSTEPTVEVELDGFYFKNPQLPKVLTQGGYFISLALAKTHGLTLITGVMKNLFGLLPRKNQMYYHSHINEVIVDLNKLIQPDLCIVDAGRGQEGVLSGRVKYLNALIVGHHPLSVDATLARIMGFEPEKIRHLKMAEAFNLGCLNPKMLGERIESMTIPFKTPRRLSPKALIDELVSLN